jgi:GR25 family glycosyltransferase involved in LPS biosynthesis
MSFTIEEKLKGLGPLYYINLSDQVEKRKTLEHQCEQYGIETVRMDAIDGRNQTSDQLVEKYLHFLPVTYHGKEMTTNELACTLSHLFTIRHWLTNSSSETAWIAEDDISFETVEKWPFRWSDIQNRLPYNFDVIQMAITFIPNHEINFQLHKRGADEHSATCYLINRWYAIKLMKLFWVDNKFFLSKVYPFSRSEEVLYRSGLVYSIPLFTYHTHYDSTIQTKQHAEYYHNYSREVVLQFWNQAHNIHNPYILFNEK